MTEPPDKRPSHYDYAVLELACNIEDSGSIVILNPRDLTITNLFDADLDWLTDKSLHRQWKRYMYDKKRG